MRVLLKTLFIFLFFVGLGGCINLNDASINSPNSLPYIQNNYQKVVLTSQNLRSAEIFAEQSNDNNSNYSGKTFGISTNFENSNNFISYNPNYHWGIIHKISTGINSVICIRAP